LARSVGPPQAQMNVYSDRDVLVIQRWLALLQRERRLYNVDNHHQCLNVEPPCIVRPFAWAPNFYGCPLCGQYHLCYLQHRECAGVVDPLSNTLTCQYSGRAIPGTERVAPIGTHEEKVRFYDKPTTIKQYMASPQKRTRFRFRPSRPLLYTNSRMYIPRASRASAQAKRAAAEAESRASGGIEAVAKRKRLGSHQERAHPMAERGGHADEQEFSSLSLSSGSASSSSSASGSEEEAEGGEEKMVVEEGSREEEDEDEEQGGGGGGAAEYEVDEELERDVRAYWNDENDEWDDTGHRQANRVHSNRNYWNEYYAFLLPLITECEAGAADGGDAEAARAASPPPAQPHFNRAILSDAMREEVGEAASLLVRQCLALQLAAHNKHLAVTNGHRSGLAHSLAAYFARIACNVATLVYNAPAMEALIAQRAQRAEKHSQSVTTARAVVREVRIDRLCEEEDAGGGGGAGETRVQSCAATLAPRAICEAVMLALLLEPFYDEDQCGCQIAVWHRNAWLARLAETHVVALLFDEADVASLVAACNGSAPPKKPPRRGGPPKKKLKMGGGGAVVVEVERYYERRRVKAAAETVSLCLRHYKGHALWLKHFILHNDQS